MPPHELLGALFEHPEMFFPLVTGEPGRIDAYWLQNQELWESLGLDETEPRPHQKHIKLGPEPLLVICF